MERGVVQGLRLRLDDRFRGEGGHRHRDRRRLVRLIGRGGLRIGQPAAAGVLRRAQIVQTAGERLLGFIPMPGADGNLLRLLRDTKLRRHGQDQLLRQRRRVILGELARIDARIERLRRRLVHFATRTIGRILLCRNKDERRSS